MGSRGAFCREARELKVGCRRRPWWRMRRADAARLGKGRRVAMCEGNVERAVSLGRERLRDVVRGAIGDSTMLTKLTIVVLCLCVCVDSGEVSVLNNRSGSKILRLVDPPIKANCQSSIRAIQAPSHHSHKSNVSLSLQSMTVFLPSISTSPSLSPTHRSTAPSPSASQDDNNTPPNHQPAPSFVPINPFTLAIQSWEEWSLKLCPPPPLPRSLSLKTPPRIDFFCISP